VLKKKLCSKNFSASKFKKSVLKILVLKNTNTFVLKKFSVKNFKNRVKNIIVKKFKKNCVKNF